MLRSGKWWWYVCLAYFGAQCLLYSQVIKTADNGTSSQTPWEHLTLESALVIAVGVQYRENRAKEAAAIQMAKDAAAAIQKATLIMEATTTAMERLSQKVEACPMQPPEWKPREKR